MKTVLFAVLAGLLLVSFPGLHQQAYGKPTYCGAALGRCLEGCARGSWLFQTGCEAGCGIGYLTCGN